MPSARPIRSSVPARMRPRWSFAVLLFLVVALVALVVVPILVDRRIRPYQVAIVAVAEPALASLSDVQLALARQMSALRGFVATGETRFLERYARWKADEEAVFPRLEAFTSDLGSSDVTGEMGRLREAIDAWDGLIEASGVLTGGPVDEAYFQGMPLEEAVYLEALRRSLTLEDAIRGASNEMREQIAFLQAVENRITLVLIFLSLAGVGAVALLGQRLRRLNADLDRRAREEVELREAADLSRREALRRARDERLLRKAAEGVSAARTNQDVARAILDHALEATRADGAFLQVRDPESGRTTVMTRGRISFPRVAERADENGAMEDERDRGDGESLVVRLAKRHERAKTILVPLGEAPDRIGCLLLLRSGEATEFEPSDLEHARVFAELATLAIERGALLRTAERRRKELELVTESRSRLVRGFSHDLKNPLGAADGHAALLESEIKGELNPHQKESIARIRATIGFAFELIDELVELGRIESGSLRVQLEPVELPLVVGQVVEEFRPQAEGAGLTLEFTVDEEVPVVETDPQRVRQVLGNLLTNAIKYTGEGTIRVRVRSDDDPATPERHRSVLVDVRDTGPGIPSDKFEFIFREFSRLEGTRGPGAGLGLAISERIAHALGGELRVKSTGNAGSTFTLVLPVRSNAPTPPVGGETVSYHEGQVRRPGVRETPPR